MTSLGSRREAVGILYVDDEPHACKWLVRGLGGEFRMLTATGAQQALALLRQHGESIAVLMTDIRMPAYDGIYLLRQLQAAEFAHLICLAVSAYADKEMLISAVNAGSIFSILEKPLDIDKVRATLHAAQAAHLRRHQARTAQAGRMIALRDTLGFLAHELNTPLAAVRNCIDSIDRWRQPHSAETSGGVLVRERHPGALQQAIATSRQAIGHAIALVASAADSAHVDPPGAERRELTAAGLVDALLAGYPFVADERAWVVLETWRDFALPECPDLIFLVLSTLTRNALQALQNHENPCLRIQIGHATHVGYDCIRFIDNGPGFPRDLFPQLGRVQCTTRADSGGSGMGLVFARRVMESVSGTIEISTAAEGGACIELLFALPSPAPAVAPHFSLKELP